MEIEANRSASYENFTALAAKKLNLLSMGYKHMLFKCNGARILDEPLTIREKKREWTLSTYLQLLKKNPNTVVIGVGSIECDEVTTSSDEEVTKRARKVQ